jgi:hypothetical protein
MNAQQIIEIVGAASGSVSELLSQLAWFFSVQAAAKWLSISLPLLILFGVLMKVATTLKVTGADAGKVGIAIFTAWVFFAGTLFTGVRGLAHVVQAFTAPAVYVLSEVGDISEAIKSIKGK